MTVWVCIRNTSVCKQGTYLQGEEGEELYPGRLIQKGKKEWRYMQTSMVGIPFATVAKHIMPIGFHVPNFTPKTKTVGQKAQEEIEAFQEYTEDIFEPENLEKNIAANPSLTPKGGSGIIVPANYKKE